MLNIVLYNTFVFIYTVYNVVYVMTDSLQYFTVLCNYYQH